MLFRSQVAPVFITSNPNDCVGLHGWSTRHESTNLKQHLEVLHALDNLCSTDDSLAVRNCYFIHLGKICSHLADIGYRDGIDTRHSRAKSNLARVIRMWSTPFNF